MLVAAACEVMSAGVSSHVPAQTLEVCRIRATQMLWVLWFPATETLPHPPGSPLTPPQAGITPEVASSWNPGHSGCLLEQMNALILKETQIRQIPTITQLPALKSGFFSR